MASKPKPDDSMPSLDAMAAAEPTVWLGFTAAPERVVEDLARRVSSGHVADRREATRELATLLRRDRSAIRPTLDALELALRDADAQVRISAMEALAPVVAAGVAPPFLRRALVRLFRDEVVVVRRQAIACFAVSFSRGWDADERVALAALLDDFDVATRVEASAAFRRATRIGDELRSWMPALVRALDDSEPVVRENVAAALEQIVSRSSDDATRLLGLLLHHDAARSHQARALVALCRKVLRDGPTSAAVPTIARNDAAQPGPPPSAAWTTYDPHPPKPPPPAPATFPPRLIRTPRLWSSPWLFRVQPILRAVYLPWSLLVRSILFSRPLIEDWERGPPPQRWSTPLLCERWRELDQWSAPFGTDDGALRDRWLAKLEAELTKRGVPIE